MLWLVMLVAATMLATIGKRTKITDDVHVLALYIGSLLSGWWGLATAPSEIQITVGILALCGIKISSHRR